MILKEPFWYFESVLTSKFCDEVVALAQVYERFVLGQEETVVEPESIAEMSSDIPF